MENILEGLNDKQKEAVKYCDGPLLILAGAGSGKTRTLTYKIAYMLDQNMLKSWEILAITFTNKAAREMKERIISLIGEEQASNMWLGTFHSICVRILKREISKSMNMKVAGNGNIYVMNEISKALMKSGIKTVKKVPSKVYSLPTKMINGIVKDLFDYVSDREFYVSGEDISIYINSADIMLEGKKELVEKVQTAIVKGFVVNNIYLTNDDKSRKIEREINSIWLKWTAEEISSEEAAVRLIKLTNQSFEEDMSYDERALLSVQLNEVQNEILIKRQKDLGISK